MIQETAYMGVITRKKKVNKTREKGFAGLK